MIDMDKLRQLTEVVDCQVCPVRDDNECSDYNNILNTIADGSTKCADVICFSRISSWLDKDNRIEIKKCPCGSKSVSIIGFPVGEKIRFIAECGICKRCSVDLFEDPISAINSWNLGEIDDYRATIGERKCQ